MVKTLVSNVYYYQDSLGSTSHVADGSGQLLEWYKYNAYGKPKYFDADGNPISNSMYNVRDLHGGARWMPELGLYDDRNRFMSPELGRFLQPDPIGFKGDASNLYRFCGNDWANRTDPMGLDNTLANPEWVQVTRDMALSLNENMIRIGSPAPNAFQAGARQVEPAKVTGQNIRSNPNSQPGKVEKGDSNSREAPTGFKKLPTGPRSPSEPYADYYKLQLVKGGTYLKDKDSWAKENVTPTGNTKPGDVITSNGKWVDMNKGVLLDRVGPRSQPGPDVNTTFTTHQVYDGIRYKAVEYPSFHAEFDQITRITNGQVTTQLIPTNSSP